MDTMPWEEEKSSTPPQESNGPWNEVVSTTAPTSVPAQASIADSLNSKLDESSPIDRTNQLRRVANWNDINRQLHDQSWMEGIWRGFTDTAVSALKAPGEGTQALLAAERKKNLPPNPKLTGMNTLFTMIGDSADWLDKNFLGKAAEIPKPVNAPAETRPWYEQIPEAAGSGLAFLSGGAGLKALGYGVGVSTAALGGAVGASNQYEEAIAQGATPDQALLGYLGGSAFGTTEAIPGAYFLNKLNKLTGGKLIEGLKIFGPDKAERGPLLEALKGMFVEGAQEGFQQVGQNWVASDLAGYDPNRTLGENFWANALTGGIVGSAFGAGHALLYRSERDHAVNQLAEEYNQKINSGDPVNFTQGNFTPVGDLLDLRKLEADAKGELSARATELSQQPIPNSDLIPESDQGPSYIGTEAGKPHDYITDLLDTRVEPTVEKGLPLRNDGTLLTVREALLRQPVVAVNVNPYAPLISQLELNIENYSKNTEALKAKGLEIKQREIVLQAMQQNLLDLHAKTKIIRRLVGNVKDYVAAFREGVSPDMKFVVMDTTYAPSEEAKRTYSGAFMLTRNTEVEPGKPQPVGAIFINMDRIATDLYSLKGEGSMEEARIIKRSLFETLNHELGHSIAVSSVLRAYVNARDEKLPPEVRKESQDILTLMSHSYARWLQDAAQSDQSFLYTTQFAPERAMHYAGIANAAISMQDKFPKSWPNKNYLLSFDEFFAEMTARLAAQGHLADPVTTRFFKPVIEQYQKIFAALPEFAKSEYGNDWKLFLQKQMLSSKVKDKLELLAGGGFKNPIDAIAGKVPGWNPENFAGLKEHLDRWGKMQAYGLNLLQLARENPHIEHWDRYLEAVTAWADYQRNFQSDAIDAYKSWRGLGKGEASKVTDVLFEEALNRKRLTPQELSTRLSAEAMQAYEQVRQQLDRVLEEMRAVSLQDATRTFYGNEEMLKAETDEINSSFDKMKDKGYFPFIRFGKFTITAKAKNDFSYEGEDYKKGQLITFPAFENEKERDAALTELKKNLGNNAIIASSVMRETDFVIQGMPRALLRTLRKKLEGAGELTAEQSEAFDKAEAEALPFRNFRKFFLKKKGIHGYSEDGLRSFAYYIRSAAGHIARVKYSDALRDPIAGMQQDVEMIKASGGRADARQEMRHWMDRHFSYIMNPDNELVALRGVGFVAYLGMNVKSAFVNMLQPITVTLPYLSARYGDTKAIAEMAKASWTLKDWATNKKDFVPDLAKEKEYWRKNLYAAVRVGGITGPAHFATNGGAKDMFDGLSESKDAKFYDLSKLNVAAPDENTWKEILKKTFEIDMQAMISGTKDQSSSAGVTGPYGVKPMLDIQARLQILQDMLSGSTLGSITNDENEELGLHRGAKALGYDAVYVTEAAEGDHFDSESTLNVFAGNEKIKEIPKAKFNENLKLIRGNVTDKNDRIARMIATLQHQGILDQSLATELAIAASENNLDRGAYLPKARRFWHEASRYSALPFHLVEKMNRYITAISAYNLEYTKSGNHAKSVLAAREANWSTNYENARWNRPTFMRGKKSVFFLFTNYVQNTLYFATHDPGATRYMLTLLLLAGMMGLPGADDVSDLVDFAATSLNRILGIKNPKVDLRRDLREHLEELHLNPDLILHGLSQNSFGLGHVGELTGIPIPRLDVSRSIGMGNILPLTEIPKAALTADSADVFMQAVGSATGASGNLVEDFYRNLFSTDPDKWKTAEKLMPFVAAKNISKAARIFSRGQEQTASGETIAKFDPHDIRDDLELLGQSLGFTPSSINLGWERQILIGDTIKYYKVQQSALLKQFDWAIFQEDREARADVVQKIKEYNQQVPFPEMGISSKAMKESAKAYIEKRMVAGMGIEAEKKYRRLREQVEESYPDPFSKDKKELGFQP